MIHVGLHSVGTHHKKVWFKKTIKICFAECQHKTLGKEVFVECQPFDTRHRFSENPKSRLCRVPVRRHSANTSLSSARFGALDKINILIFKKSLSSAASRALGKEVELNRSTASPSSLSHSRSLSLTPPHRARRRPRARPRHRTRARPHRRTRARPQPCARARRRPSSRPRPRARAHRRRPCPATPERRRRNTPAPTRPASRHQPRPSRRPPHAPGSPPPLPAPSTVGIIVICYLIY
jgi:hypothetical protein